MTRRVLLVDDDRAVRDALCQTLELAGLLPLTAASFVEAKDHIAADFDGVVVTDVRMPGRDGFHLLDHVRATDPELPVIVLTGHADVALAVRSMAAGARAFLEKPCAPSALVDEVNAALLARRTVLEARRARRVLAAGDAAERMLFGTSDMAVALRAQVRAAAAARGEVLISGEAGTGTSKVAEVLHLLSPAAHAPFVKRSAISLTPETLKSAFAEAGGGTLYLDEIAAAPGEAQFALLDTLDHAGGAVRVVAGSTRALDAEVTAGRFGADLYWRLNVLSVRIPSLRERPGDIPELFGHYVAQACEQANIPPPAIPAEMGARLMSQEWPGNARALMNAAMRFALGVAEPGQGRAPVAEPGRGLSERMAEVERTILIDALRQTGGQASEAAVLLKLPRKTFYDKLARHDLRPEDFRGDDRAGPAHTRA